MRTSLVFSLRARNLDVLSAAEAGIHAGLILAPQQRYPLGEELRRLMRLLGDVTAEDMRNRIEFLSAWF